VGLLLPVIFAGCKREAPDTPVKADANAPSVLLITLDTTRADRLGCYGHAAAQTPALDSLAASGVRFNQAFCQVPLTLPSHTSILTGTYPASNGVRVNGTNALGEGIPTLAEVFHRKGYRTGAFVAAAVLDDAFGLARGFDDYDDQLTSYTSNGKHAERRGDVVCDAALKWLSESGDAPFFAWVHFFDAHDPYAPPEPFLSNVSDPYDGEIAFVDSQVRRLLDWLETKDRTKRTLIVVAGDHGEAFEEHGETRHGFFVYTTTMHVPLIISFPSVLPAGRSVDAVVRLVDVFDTVIELMGWESPGGTEGSSLVAACRTGQAATLPAYGESEYPHIAYGWAPLRSLTTTKWKYIDAPTPELYDRVEDPGELNNLAPQQGAAVSQMHRQLQTMLKQMQPRATTSVSLDAETRKQLESLGYLGTGAASRPSSDDGPLQDPKDMIAAYRTHMKAAAALQEAHYDDVVAMMEPLVERSPQSDEFQATLGTAYLGLGRGVDAQKAFEASLRRTPDHADRLCGLGDALRLQGRKDDAIRIYQLVLSTSPDSGAAHSRLGRLYAELRQFPAALTHFRRACEIDPTSANALSNLGNVLMALGRPEEAAATLRRALAYDRHYAPAHQVLWQALSAMGRPTEAVRALRAACAELPNDTEMALRLAWVLATTTRDDLRHAQEALRLAKQVCDHMAPTPHALDVLAAAQASVGDFVAAVETARQALELARAQDTPTLTQRMEGRIRLYEAGRPFRQ